MTRIGCGRASPVLGTIGVALLLSSIASGQQEAADVLLQQSLPVGEGWRGFADLGFIANSLFTLTLATVLGAVLAYHPKHRELADTREEIEAPKIYVLYAMIGALIGIMVVKFGLIVGFVLFGIGGLIRFRTVLRSASLTGHLIFVTLVGLSCGLDLPHVAVLATAFGFVLIYVLDSHVVHSIDVRALPAAQFAAAAAAYRSLLEREGCRVLSEKKDPEKRRITLMFRAKTARQRRELEALLDGIDAPLKGSVDWEMD